jgi:acetylornithine/N-succinyldiaminopimelate aminotransferase
VGACLASENAAQFMVAGTHGSTFGGNPLAMSAANAVLDVVLAPGFLEQVTATADKLWSKLRPLVAKYPKVYEEVRGKGLMIGLKCHVPNKDIVEKFMAHGLLSVVGGENVVRLLPPLIIGDAEIDAAIGMIDKASAELSS